MNSIADQRWENLGYLAEEICGSEGWAVRGKLRNAGMSLNEIETALMRIDKRQGPLWATVGRVIADWKADTARKASHDDRAT